MPIDSLDRPELGIGNGADDDHDGAATWRRITAAVEQLANNTPPGPVH